jgi:hypothetical protein
MEFLGIVPALVGLAVVAVASTAVFWIFARAFWDVAAFYVRTARKHQPLRPFEENLPLRGRWLNYVLAALYGTIALLFTAVTLLVVGFQLYWAMTATFGYWAYLQGGTR